MKPSQANNLTETLVSTIDKSPFKKGEFKKLRKFFNRTIYFSPRKRQKQNSFLLDMQKYLKTVWALKDNPVYFSKEEREDIIDLSAISSKLLSFIKRGEEWTKSSRLLHKKFYLYSHIKNPGVLIELRYYKVYDKQFKIAGVLIPKGIPEKGQVHKGKFIRKELPKKGWELLDEGIYSMKYLDFYELNYTFRGKKLKFKLHAQASAKSIDSFHLFLLPYIQK